METLEQKLKQFKHTTADGRGYPKGYKANINAYMEGFNSGRYNVYLDKDFVETRRYVNEELAKIHQFVKKDWKSARMTVVAKIIGIEQNQRKNELLYGNCTEVKKERELKKVLEFVCDSLPTLNEGE